MPRSFSRAACPPPCSRRSLLVISRSPRATAASPRRQARRRRPLDLRSLHPPSSTSPNARRRAAPPRRTPRPSSHRSVPVGRRPRPGRTRDHRVRPAPRAVEAPRRRRLRSLRAGPADRHPAPGASTGPSMAAATQWVHVAPVELTLDGASPTAGSPIADHDGTPWVALADAPLAGLDVAQAAVARAPVNVGDAKRTAGDLNAFGLALYKRLLADPDAKLNGKGVVMSPASIAVALAMARAGARGTTATQMDRVLRDSDWNDLGAGLGSLQQILAGYNGTWQDDEGTSHSLSLDVTNRAFGQIGGSILDGYPRSASGRRSAPASDSSITSGTPTAPAPRSTAGWRGRRTTASSSCLGPTDVTGSTRLVLVNAIYMKANWLMEFDPVADEEPHVHDVGRDLGQRPDDAHRRRASPSCSRRATAGRQPTCCTSGAGFTTPLAMTLILPDEPQGVRARPVGREAQPDPGGDRCGAQAQLQGDPVPDGDMNCPVYPYDLTLSLPKFGIDTRASLLPTLQAMGMTRRDQRQSGRLLRDHRAVGTCSSPTSSTRRTSTSTRRAPRPRPRRR